MNKISKPILKKVAKVLKDNGFQPPFSIKEALLNMNNPEENLNQKISETLELLRYCERFKNSNFINKFEQDPKNKQSTENSFALFTLKINQIIEKMSECFLSKEDEKIESQAKASIFWKLKKIAEDLIKNAYLTIPMFENYVCEFPEQIEGIKVASK